MDVRDQTPVGRTEGLLTEDLDDESLVYDLSTHEVHCLNPAAALILRACDGRTPIREMASLLDRVGVPPDESLVWMGLRRLEAARLVGPLDFPGSKASFSRKAVLRALGATAALTLLAPALHSVVAPMALHAASCITNAECKSYKQPNCPGTPVCNNKGQPSGNCCLPRGRKNCRRVAC